MKPEAYLCMKSAQWLQHGLLPGWRTSLYIWPEPYVFPTTLITSEWNLNVDTRALLSTLGRLLPVWSPAQPLPPHIAHAPAWRLVPWRPLAATVRDMDCSICFGKQQPRHRETPGNNAVGCDSSPPSGNSEWQQFTSYYSQNTEHGRLLSV